MPILILRKGENTFDASEQWWPANCMCCGALFKYKNEYLICSGKTPAVVYVSALQWLGHSLAWLSRMTRLIGTIIQSAIPGPEIARNLDEVQGQAACGMCG